MASSNLLLASSNLLVANTSTELGASQDNKDEKKNGHHTVRRKDAYGRIIQSFGIKADKMLKYYPDIL